jgi:hypothetical protein
MHAATTSTLEDRGQDVEHRRSQAAGCCVDRDTEARLEEKLGYRSTASGPSGSITITTGRRRAGGTVDVQPHRARADVVPHG